MIKKFVSLVFIAFIPGCAMVDFSGLDAKSDFACKAPQGVSCKSVSGIYANSTLGNLPAQKIHEDDIKLDKDKKEGSGASKSLYDEEERKSLVGKMKAPTSGTPYRTQDVVLRIWMAPWEDSEYRLHDQHYIYTTVKSGSWLIEANRRRIKDEYKSIKPLSMKNSDDKDRDDVDTKVRGSSTRNQQEQSPAQVNAQRVVIESAQKLQKSEVEQ